MPPKIVALALLLLLVRTSSSQTVPANKSCTRNEFRCTNGNCIPIHQKCNGKYDCEDLTDETMCTSCKPFEQFNCPAVPTICYPNHLRCDNTSQCNDKSDEENCVRKGECLQNQVKCYDGTCINGPARCDGKPDCSSGEDELGCPTTETTAPTISSTPVPEPRTCAPGQFQCRDGQCMLGQIRCDGVLDCRDSSDEESCPSTTTPKPCLPPTDFLCRSGLCINATKRCDGRLDCPDRSDEESCTFCKSNEFRCDSRRCIPYNRRCDGYPDCSDQTDEQDCPTQSKCEADQYECNDGSCVPLTSRCNGVADCADFSDEATCPQIFPYTTTTTTLPPPTSRPPIVYPPPFVIPFCRSDEFTCRIRFQCIRGIYLCDGSQDCSDNSDENNCTTSTEETPRLNLRVIPAEQVIKESQEVVFQCRDEGLLRVPITWERSNGLELPPGSRVLGSGRLEIPNVQLSHAGTYVCRTSDDYRSLPGSRVQVRLDVEPFSTPRPTPPLPRCRSDQATCHNGECIAKSQICNGQIDCADGSDEVRCNLHGCEPNEFRCRNLRCVSKTWRCDSEDDCLDGSDEENCEPAPPGSRCQYNEFACTNSTQCIPKAMQCDFETDCLDGTDEFGCSKVVIIQPPEPNVRRIKGETFYITCRTIGVPTPEVIWRLNWGHVPAKCRTTSVNGFGTLTCPDIQPEDQGAYSCEAINSRGSTFASVDTILIVEYSEPKCPDGKFSLQTAQPDVCIDCFCFGVSTNCTSANLFKYHLPPSNYQFRIINVHFDRRRRDRLEIRGNEISDSSITVDVISGDRFRVRGVIAESVNLENIFPYVALPDTYSGNQVRSYGGNITFKVRYENDGPPEHSPHIIIAGNGKRFVHGLVSLFLPGEEKLINVQLIQGQWFQENEDFSVPVIRDRRATREEIMTVLANVEYILLKTQWTTNRNIDVTYSEFKFDSAVPANAGFGHAEYVEKCTCPAGYSGLSCHHCEPGYERVRSNTDEYGTCQRIPISCPSGSFGDPVRGIPCRPCPCPLTSSGNKFGHTCYLDSDGSPTCNCPPGYEGRNCERCSAGFNGNPLVVGSACERTPCDPAGSASLYLDPISRSCSCKRNVIGPFCRLCKPGTFYLHPANQYGCIDCFCMGVSRECQSSALYRQLISATFGQGNEEFKIALRKDVATSPISDIFVNPPEQEIIYRPDYANSAGVLYWILPQKFLNDKLTSYGGVLNYTLRFISTPDSPRNTAPDVEIYSSTQRLRLLYYRVGNPLQPGTHQTVTVPLREQYWQREDGQIVDRAHFLMTLSHVTMIIIKASDTTATEEVALQSVVMETAEDRNTGLSRAYEVEECRCPTGHRGTSCQQCSPGFYKTDNLYLGLCQRCDCNGRSTECDPETGYCLNCAGHTQGPKCQECEPGYVGDPATGCVRSSGPSCPCDPRGSIDSTCREGQCNCKANVIGPYCDRCRPGTFDLHASRREGCLNCYCSGVSQQCQSSNYFVTQLPISILNQNPGFTLTDSNRNRFIETGFVLTPDKNEIQFDYTPERGNRLYWSLPPQFTGNKITSYGGNLSWTQGFNAPRDHIVQYDNDLIIIGDGISLFWTNNIPILANQATPISVKLEEDVFRRITVENGTQIASRKDLLRVLSNIEAILIRAVYASQTTSVYISDVVLDVAVNQPVSNTRATQVESCSCPPGYKGSSCEACDRGYYHTVSDNEGSKQCLKCPCNDNEESCHVDTSSKVTCRCRPGFAGEFCEGTAATFYLKVELLPTSEVHAPVNTEANLTCTYKSSEKFSIEFWKNYTNGVVQVPVQSERLYAGPNEHNLNGGWIGKQNFVFEIESDLREVICVVRKEGTSTIFGNLEVARAAIQPSPVPDQNSTDSPSTVTIMIREPLIQIVAVGGTVHYTCRATSRVNRPVYVSWTKEGGRLPLDRTIDDGTGYLVLMNAVPSDSGIYVCLASDGVSRVRQEVNITVGDTKPKIILTSLRPDGSASVIDSNGEVEVIAGDLLNIKCEATGTPTPSVEWLKVGSTNTRKVIGPGEVSYIVTSMSLRDAGVYYCRASNAFGTYSQKVTIHVRDTVTTPPPITAARVSIQPPSFGGVVGESVRLQCSSDAPFRHRFEWSRNSNLPLPERAVSDPVRGELVMYNVVPADSGLYICKVINEITRNEVGKNEAYVTIVNEPETGPPTLTIDPESQKVPQGGLALIRCISSDPRAQIVWRKLNEDITNSPDILIRGSELRIPSAQIRNRGNYMCSATNSHGSALRYSRLEVDRREPPSIEIYPRERQLILEGENSLFQCKVNRGVPAPRVRWHRPGNLIFSPRVEDANGVLKFSQVTAEDEGEYICSAENPAGHVDAIAFVEIVSRPTIFLPPSPIIVSAGQYLRLDCRAEGRPTPAVYWKSVSLPVSPYDHNVPSNKHTAVYEITRASLSDTGVYTCVATNTAGQVEEQVQVSVIGSVRPTESNASGIIPPSFIPSLPPDGEVAFPLGSRATLRCDTGSQNEHIYLYWKREGGEQLSEHREEQNGNLIIYDVKRTDAGKYSCIGYGDRGSVLFSKTVNLIIIAPPQIQLSPVSQLVRPGDDAYVLCSATGDQPITIYWSSVGNNQLPRSVSVDQGMLKFRGITIYDAGKYVCRAENAAGRAESVAEVIVTELNPIPSKPIIRATEQIQSAFEGTDTTLKCNVISATPGYQIKWTRDKSKFGLPRRALPQGDTLHLFKVTTDDTGRYSCEVHSPYGVSSDSIELYVERTCLSDEFRCNDGTCIVSSQLCDSKRDCPDNSDEMNCHYHRRGINKTLDNDVKDHHINVGGSLRLPCSLNEESGQVIEGQWLKIDGSFDSNVKTIGNILSIDDAMVSNSGTYRCTMLTNYGEHVEDYKLSVKSANPDLIVALTTKTVEYGEDVDLICDTHLEESANYSWVLHTQNKAFRKIIKDKKVITVSNATVSNSGLYFCNVAGKESTYKLPTMLIVENVIPAFKESSYMTFPPLTQATMSFDIKIKFKPEHSEGLILYSIQNKDGKGDFLAFGLQKGYPELKFDMGSKPFTIRGDEPLSLNQWHTVRLIRNGRIGIIEIDEIRNYTANYDGKHMTLDLPLPLWVGGVSNYAVTRNVGYSVGLTGCISSLVIDGKSYDFKRDVLRTNEPYSCNSCRKNQCQHGGGCQESPSSNTGYLCICPPGFSGEHCNIVSETCYSDTCGPGQCLENGNGSGVECQCPMGTSGQKCQEKISIDVPAFTRNSYLAYSTPLSMKNKLEFSLIVKPAGETQVHDGIILYVAENKDGIGDYIAISIVNGYIQLTGKIVSKSINIQSGIPLTPLRNVTIFASIDASNAKLEVDDEKQEEEFNPTNEIINLLKLHTDLYVGGYDKKSIILPEDIRGRVGLNGCVSSVKLFGTEIKQVQTHTDSANVQDCKTTFGDACEKNKPCRNNGSCVPSGVRTYTCVCPGDYGGQNCERHKNICEKLNPCKNNGECQVTGNDTYLCSCILGFIGSICEETTTVENSVSFSGNGGYVELSSALLPHETTQENILVTFVTKSYNGLLLWQGSNKTVLEPDDDFIAISIQNGYVQTTYRVQNDLKELKSSDHRVNDGKPHTVIVRFSPKSIEVELDDRHTDYRYMDRPQLLRTGGNIYIGGLPDIRYKTKNTFRETFSGCVQTLKFNNGQAISFGSKAISASNAAPCAIVKVTYSIFATTESTHEDLALYEPTVPLRINTFIYVDDENSGKSYTKHYFNDHNYFYNHSNISVKPKHKMELSVLLMSVLMMLNK